MPASTDRVQTDKFQEASSNDDLSSVPPQIPHPKQGDVGSFVPLGRSQIGRIQGKAISY